MMDNPITKRLFDDIEKRFQADNYNKVGTSNPVNVLLNHSDDITQACKLWFSIKEQRKTAQQALNEIDSILQRGHLDDS